MARTLVSTSRITLTRSQEQTTKQTVAPGQTVKYKWYAGDVRMNGTTHVATPIEFGATNLISSDPIKHSNKGAIASLIIEPQGATWIEDTNSRAQATVSKTDGTSFREFVLQFQTDINMRRGDLQGDAAAVPNVAGEEDPEDSGQKALNYRSEPMWKRMNYAPDLPLEQTREIDFTNSLSNAQVGGDPVTPIFTARAGTPVRFRVLNSNGHARNNVFQVTDTYGNKSHTSTTRRRLATIRCRSGKEVSRVTARPTIWTLFLKMVQGVRAG